MFLLGKKHCATFGRDRDRRRSPLHFSWSPFSLFMSQHYSNAFIEKTVSSKPSNLALPFSDYLQRERWGEPKLIRSACPRNISVPYRVRSLRTVVLVQSVTTEHFKIEKESLSKISA